MNLKGTYTPYFSLSTNICWRSAHSTFKMIGDSCWACLELISVLSVTSDDIIQVDELSAIGIYLHVVLKLCLCGTQFGHTLFSGKSHTMLALCCDFKAADYTKNHAGIILASLPLSLYSLLRGQTRWGKHTWYSWPCRSPVNRGTLY